MSFWKEGFLNFMSFVRPRTVNIVIFFRLYSLCIEEDVKREELKCDRRHWHGVNCCVSCLYRCTSFLLYSVCSRELKRESREIGFDLLLITPTAWWGISMHQRAAEDITIHVKVSTPANKCVSAFFYFCMFRRRGVRSLTLKGIFL